MSLRLIGQNLILSARPMITGQLIYNLLNFRPPSIYPSYRKSLSFTAIIWIVSFVKFVADEENLYHCSSALDPDSRLVVYASSTFNNEDTIQCAQHQVAVAAGLLSKDFAVEMDPDRKNPVAAAGKYFSVTPFSLAIYSYCLPEPNHTALCIINSFENYTITIVIRTNRTMKPIAFITIIQPKGENLMTHQTLIPKPP